MGYSPTRVAAGLMFWSVRASGAMPEGMRIADPHVSRALSLSAELCRAFVPGFFLHGRSGEWLLARFLRKHCGRFLRMLQVHDLAVCGRRRNPVLGNLESFCFKG